MRTIALALVVVGAVTFAIPTFATEGFNTDRPTSFAIGSEDEALIGFETTGNTIKHSEKLNGSGPPTVTVGHLINNFGSELSLTYKVRTDDSSVTTHPPDDSGQSKDMTIGQAQKGAIDLRCEPGDQGTGTAGVTVTVESAYADGIGVEDTAFDFRVEYDCTPPANQGGEWETEKINEYCADTAVGEDENENNNENENSGDKYKYTYDYDYDYKNGKYRYEYEYDYEWSKNADQDPNPDPRTSPDQSLDCVNDEVDIDLDPDPDPDPDPPDEEDE